MAYATHPTREATKLPTFEPATTVFALPNALLFSFRKLMIRQEPDAMSVREAQIRREDAYRRVNNLLR